MFVSGATVVENLVCKLPSSRLPMSIKFMKKAKKTKIQNINLDFVRYFEIPKSVSYVKDPGVNT